MSQRTNNRDPPAKKEDQQSCNNYRGPIILYTAYKILSTLIQRRLAKMSKNIAIIPMWINPEKATSESIHTNGTLYRFYAVFRFTKKPKTDDGSKGNESKLRRWINMTIGRSAVNIETQKGETS